MKITLVQYAPRLNRSNLHTCKAFVDAQATHGNYSVPSLFQAAELFEQYFDKSFPNWPLTAICCRTRCMKTRGR